MLSLDMTLYYINFSELQGFSHWEKMISLQVKINLISSQMKISVTLCAIKFLTKFIVEQTYIYMYFYMIDTSSKIAQTYLATFSNLQTSSEIFRKWSQMFVNFGQSLEHF